MTIKPKLKLSGDTYLEVMNELSKIQKDLESIKLRIESNDLTIWEYLGAYNKALSKHNLDLPMVVKANNDPFQKKLRC